MLLALDTASSVVTAAVHDGTRVLVSQSVPDSRRHTETLVPTIDSLMSRAGLAPRDLDAVAVGVGPGPFTGLRVGVVTATTLGLTLGIPVYGVCSLDAIAHQVAATGGWAQFLVATDARRREVYWALYTAHGGVLSRDDGPAVRRPADLPAHVRGLPVAGRGPALYPESFAVGIPVTDVDAGALAGLAVHRLEHGGELLDPVPLYLRDPDAKPSTGIKSVLI